MYLEKVLVFNYKSCKFLDIELKNSSPNVFIGENDSGKSTMMQAVQLLLSSKSVISTPKNDSVKSDICNTALTYSDLNTKLNDIGIPNAPTGTKAFILGKFKFDKEDVKELEKSSATGLKVLEWSHFMTKELLMAKSFDENGASRTYVIIPDYIVEDEVKNIFNLKEKELKQIQDEHKITDIKNENETGKASVFERARAIVESFSSRKTFYEIDLKGKALSVFWEFFPEVRTYDWKFSLKDLSDTASDILGKISAEKMRKVKQELVEIESDLTFSLNEQLAKSFDNVVENNNKIEKIVANVDININERVTDILVEKTGVVGKVHLESQGEGLKKQIWFTLIKAAAENLCKDTNQNKYVWLFDEPETHLYPRAQRELFDTFSKMTKNGFQIILSTHSTVFVDKSDISQVLRTKVDSSGETVVSGCNHVQDIFDSLGVKNSDFLFYDKFLVVEGDTEVTLISKLYELYTERSLTMDNIRVINLGGETKFTQSREMINSLFEGFSNSDSNVFYLFDNDVDENRVGDNIFRVGQFDIEDSFSNEVWKKYLNELFIGAGFSFRIEDIQSCRDAISENKKMFKCLETLVHKKTKLSYPEIGKSFGKGASHGSRLGSTIDNVEQIPQVLRDLFEKIKA